MSWTFRKIALGASAALLLVVSLLVTAIVTANARLHEISLELMSVSNNLRITQELEANILVHGRESLLWNLTADRLHLERRDNIKVVFENWLDEIGKFVDSPEEILQLASVKKSAADYFLMRFQFESNNEPALIIVKDVTPYIDRLLIDLKKFTLINLEQAKIAHKGAVDTETEVIRIGSVAIIVALLCLVGLMGFLWKQVYIPLNNIAVSINDLAGGTKITPVLTKISEVSIIWHALYESSRLLQVRKETQLRYLAAVAHDLRNPIGAISAAITLLSDTDLDPQDTPEITQIIYRQVDYLNTMVSDLLDTTRAESGSLSLKMATMDLRTAVGDAVNLFQGYSKTHSISYECPPDAVLCKFDATRMSQVFNNLVSNAIKYSPLGGMIAVSLVRTDDAAVVRITDTGIGVSDEDKTTIFEPFRRSSGTKDTIPGVGLGLFTSRKIVVSHGGNITVESSEGSGATFVVKIPMR